ncbi:transglycosylase SLT domain-containing protein [Streptomyces sp. NPDC005209]|uniref:transglycosylase SLT domain-containing protein n=1 Tax=Streptomyces sp. NPDC005209 TaxID=3156715 RepID=UPI0033AA0617
MTAITATRRLARLRTIALTGIATTGAATVALTLMPASAQAAEAPQVAHSVAAVSSDSRADSSSATGATGSLDGWIKKSLAVMKEKGIPGSYDGLRRNIMRESGGNPNAQNNWDVNAQKGTPSKGLLQVIEPTFNAYHVAGTPQSVTDPVANITAAANYAAQRYGSIDNVNSAY